jgi:hypothetical protein
VKVTFAPLGRLRLFAECDLECAFRTNLRVTTPRVVVGGGCVTQSRDQSPRALARALRKPCCNAETTGIKPATAQG